MKLGVHYDEKRTFARMDLNAEVHFTISDDLNTYSGQCRNLSHTGIQFDTGHGLSEGQTLNVTVDTNSDKFDPMKAKVTVLRIESNENDQYRIAGKIVKFSRS